MSNTDTLDRFVSLVAVGDLEPALQLLHPDVVVHEAASLPYPGEFKGRDGFARLLEQVIGCSELTIDATELLAAGETVVARMNTTFTSRATGKATPMAITEIYRFTDGLISYIDVFYKDTKAIIDLHRDEP